MSTTNTESDVVRVRLAIDRLKQSERGQEALSHLKEWLKGESLTGLDGTGQTALANVIMGLWGPDRGSVIDMVRNGQVD